MRIVIFCWALVETAPGSVSVEFRQAAYDVEAPARAVEAWGPPSESADLLREVRGYA